MPGSPSADSDARDKDDAVTANKSSDGGGMTVATQGETAQVPMAQPASIARSSSPRDDGGSGSNSAKSSKTSPPPAASASDLAATTPVSASSPPSHPHDEGPAIQALAQHPEPPPRGRKQRIPERLQNKRKRGHTPPAAYSRRDGRDDGHARDRRRSRSRSRSRPLSRPHDGATREHQPGGGDRGGVDAGEPPRQRKRPGGGARVGQAALDAVRRRQEERERARYEELHRRAAATGVHDVVREHYNAIPERGREWRKTDSRIKGLRAFNNWVKSCVIQKFAPDEDFVMPPQPQQGPRYGRADYHDHHHHQQGEPPRRLLVADLGCGKGGDLGKWQQCPQPVALYVGLDPAEISIQQARDRYMDMRSRRRRGGGGGGGGGGGPHQLFHAEFVQQPVGGGVPPRLDQRAGLREQRGLRHWA
ncbi:mRNA cap guanine-N7 methyltransferase [Ascosphaera acerosa]|nr:mRNA cap guanine-N7 methyltransferase [Ascosphaera acerosa]